MSNWAKAAPMHRRSRRRRGSRCRCRRGIEESLGKEGERVGIDVGTGVDEVDAGRDRGAGGDHRVGADQHHGVGARRIRDGFPGAMVVADHERDRGVMGDGDVEAPRGPHDVRGVGANGRDRLVEVEVGATGNRAHGERTDDERQHEQEDAAEESRGRFARGRRLAIAGDRATVRGWEDGMAVAVAPAPRPTPLFSVVRIKRGGALEGACGDRIAESTRLPRFGLRASARPPRPGRRGEPRSPRPGRARSARRRSTATAGCAK